MSVGHDSSRDGRVGVSRPGERARDPEEVLRRGERLGRFEIRGVIGKGGAGIVYEAFDLAAGAGARCVALKVLAADQADEEAARRFAPGFARAAQVAHRHLVRLFDTGITDGCLWFSAQRLVGKSLREELPRVGLDVARAVCIAAQAARGLAAAHAASVIHGDLRPSNIFLATEGDEEVVKVLDLGILGALGVAVGVRSAYLVTPHFVAPEYADGIVDERTDVFVLGAVIYQMLTGRPPFEGRPLRQLHEARAVGARRDLPEPAGEVVRKALQCAPSDRYQTAIELAEALEAMLPVDLRQTLAPNWRPPSSPWAMTLPADAPPSIMDEGDVAARSSMRHRARLWWLLAVGVVLGVAACAFFLWLWRR